MIISYRTRKGKVTTMHTPPDDPVELWVMERVQPYRPKHTIDQFMITAEEMVNLGNELQKEIMLDINRFGSFDSKTEYAEDVKRLLEIGVPFYRVVKTHRASL